MNDPQCLTKRQAKASKAGKASAKKRWGAKLPEKIEDQDMLCHWSDWGNGQEAKYDDTNKVVKALADKINAILDYLNSKEGEEKVQSFQNWEYKVEHTSSLFVEDCLNKYSNEGWLLINIPEIVKETNRSYFVLILKRPKNSQ